jgi:hypothetical protein
MSLSSYERRIVTEICRTLFPWDPALPISGEEAGVIERVEAYVMDIPPLQRTEIRALLVGFDVGFSATMLKPFTRFVDAKPEHRTAYITKCENMRGALRMAFDGVRFIFLLAYVESPAVSRALGIEHGWLNGELAAQARAAAAGSAAREAHELAPGTAEDLSAGA